MVTAPFRVLMARPSSSYAPIRCSGGYCHSSALHGTVASGFNNSSSEQMRRESAVVPSCLLLWRLLPPHRPVRHVEEEDAQQHQLECQQPLQLWRVLQGLLTFKLMLLCSEAPCKMVTLRLETCRL